MNDEKKIYLPDSVQSASQPPPGEIRIMSTRKLYSGQPYQRPVKEAAVNKLIQEWDNRLLEPVSVSFRENRFNVIDGQHRIVALKKMNGGEDVLVACRIYTGLTYEQEAELCYKLDKAKKRLTLAQSTNALAESEKDPRIAEIRRLLAEHGFSWALGNSTGRSGEITSTRAVINAYQLLGGTAFDRMLELLERTWHGNAYSLRGEFLSGMAQFVKAHETELNPHTFVKRLSGAAPSAIISLSKTDCTTKNAGLRIAKLLRIKYNTGRGVRKLPYRFDQ